jgi:alginate O-acetyltransferase complex protein AlgI
LLIAHRLYINFVKDWKDFLTSKFWTIIKIILFFHLVVLGWLFFRATSVTQIFAMLSSLAQPLNWKGFVDPLLNIALILSPLLAIQIGQYKTDDLLFLYKLPKIYKIIFYALMTYLMIGYGLMKAEQFIYFQF